MAQFRESAQRICIVGKAFMIDQPGYVRIGVEEKWGKLAVRVRCLLEVVRHPHMKAVAVAIGQDIDVVIHTVEKLFVL